MGENYRINGRHVGKASNRGPGRYVFIWAMPPREFVALVADHTHDKPRQCRGCEKHVGPLNDYCESCMGGGTCRHADDECEICQAALAVLEASSEEYDSIGQHFS